MNGYGLRCGARGLVLYRNGEATLPALFWQPEARRESCSSAEGYRYWQRLTWSGARSALRIQVRVVMGAVGAYLGETVMIALRRLPQGSNMASPSVVADVV